MDMVLAEATTGSTTDGVNWTAAQAIVGAVAALASLIPLVFWFVERRDRKEAQAEARDLRAREQIKHVHFQPELREVSAGVQRWRVHNDSTEPMPHLELRGWTDDEPRLLFAEVMRPQTSVLVEVSTERGWVRDPYLLAVDADWRTWRIAYLGRPELQVDAPDRTEN